MRLFRRVDQTVPVPPPAGMKWVVSKSMLARDGRPLTELGLWDERLHPNEWGVVPSDSDVIALDALPAAHAYFEATKPRQIRKASLEALAKHVRNLTESAAVRSTRIRIEGNPE